MATDPILVIMEFISRGKLQTYLRESRAERLYGNLHGSSKHLSSRDLTAFSYQVAKGMDYLVNKGVSSVKAQPYPTSPFDQSMKHCKLQSYFHYKSTTDVSCNFNICLQKKKLMNCLKLNLSNTSMQKNFKKISCIVFMEFL